MLGETIKSKIVPRDYDLFFGMDVDKKSIDATIHDHSGLKKTIHLPHKAENLLATVRHNYPNKRIAFAYEVGPTGYGLYDSLSKAGYPCLVLAPSMIPQIPGRMVKTNRLDSQKISLSLRGGELVGIHVPSMTYRQLRHMTQLRETYVREQMAIKCRIKSLLLFEGISFPSAALGHQWSARVIRELQDLQCGPVVKFTLEQLLKTHAFMREQMVGVTKEIRRFCKEDPELKRYGELLMSIPGIGWIVAMHLMARLGDWRIFRRGGEVSSFLGVVPRERSTGEVVRKGRITKAGDERVRNKLIQAAWAAIQRDGELREFYERICRRHPRGMGAKKAITAVANKLCKRIACVLREQRPYVVRRECPSQRTEEETKAPVKTRPAAERGSILGS